MILSVSFVHMLGPNCITRPSCLNSIKHNMVGFVLAGNGGETEKLLLLSTLILSIPYEKRIFLSLVLIQVSKTHVHCIAGNHGHAPSLYRLRLCRIHIDTLGRVHHIRTNILLGIPILSQHMLTHVYPSFLSCFMLLEPPHFCKVSLSCAKVMVVYIFVDFPRIIKPSEVTSHKDFPLTKVTLFLLECCPV